MKEDYGEKEKGETRYDRRRNIWGRAAGTGPGGWGKPGGWDETRRLGKQGDGAGLCGWLKRKLNVKLDRAAVEN